MRASFPPYYSSEAVVDNRPPRDGWIVCVSGTPVDHILSTRSAAIELAQRLVAKDYQTVSVYYIVLEYGNSDLPRRDAFSRGIDYAFANADKDGD